jgi:ferredoxin
MYGEIALALPEMKPARAQIEIDASKCTTPMACTKCLNVCPQVVFHVMVLKQEKFEETDINEPGAYVIIPLHRWKCTLCNLCVDNCPVDAIKITLRGGN